MPNITRRDAFKIGAAATLTISHTAFAQPGQPSAARKRALRVAHITDIHVQPELGAAEGLAACLRHIHRLPDLPQLILNGGDAVMDVCSADAARAAQQAQGWQKILKAECTIPIEHCIGNHDIWGVDKTASSTTGNEADWGKKWAMKLYGLKDRYRTFDRVGWRFIILDSMTLLPGGYAGQLDDEQFKWLSKTLDATEKAMPVLVLSHIPILAAAAYFDGENEKTGNWVVPGAWMHIDARALKTLFAAHPNVKVCLSGHVHLVDRVEYAGTTYLCDGAVCANWWRGPYQECHEGYGLIDLFDDGTFEHQYVQYGWKARP